MNVTEQVDLVLAATTELRDVRERLAVIDEERRTLEDRAHRLLQAIAGAADDALHFDELRTFAARAASVSAPEPKKTTTDRVLEFLADNSGAYSAAEVAEALGLSGESKLNTIRGTLSRLTSEGRITRTGFGQYTKNEEGKENAPPKVDEAFKTA